MNDAETQTQRLKAACDFHEKHKRTHTAFALALGEAVTALQQKGIAVTHDPIAPFVDEITCCGITLRLAWQETHRKDCQLLELRKDFDVERNAVVLAPGTTWIVDSLSNCKAPNPKRVPMNLKDKDDVEHLVSDWLVSTLRLYNL